MNYMKYNRTFVMLEEQTREYSTREAPVKGYLKVETGNNKGALRCVVQNLKYYGRGDYIYKLILFGKKKEKTIHAVLGSLIINRNGNGETYFRFNPLDVDGKGNCYDDYTVAIVAAASGTDSKEALHPVLKGTMGGETDFFQQKEQYTEKDIEEEPVETNEYRRAEEQLMERMREQEQEQECEQEREQEQEQECERKQEQQQIKERMVYNSFYNEHLLHFCGYTCKTADYYEEVKPFERDLTGARWKRVLNVGGLPFVSPGAHYFAAMYKHYLFGAKPGPAGLAEEFYFAIPGRFTQEEQPDGGRSGFVYWQPVASTQQDQSSYGYWIVAINAKTGDIQEVCF
ncbi:MAG: hypothetical protein PHE41_08940 [Eubacteriales bacterium]|nr:hypothetical protein [Eubacteriales bacterium]